MALAENLGYILIGFIALVLIFLVTLGLLEKKLHIRFLKGRYKRNEIYIEKISKINVNNTKEGLRQLDKIGKDFFREAFHLKGMPEYSFLQTYFYNKNNRKATQFSNEILRFMYSKEDPTKEKLHELIQLLAEIIASNKIITKDEKEELDKKSKKSAPLLGQIHIPGITKKKHN